MATGHGRRDDQGETGRHAKPRTLRRILHHLDLSYSKLNPIEIQWRIPKYMLVGRYFGSADDLVSTITNLIDSGQTKLVKLMNYLAH